MAPRRPRNEPHDRPQARATQPQHRGEPTGPRGAARPDAATASPASEVEKYLSGLASWSADFTQTIDDGHGNVLRSAAGRLYLQRPGKFRWDYSRAFRAVDPGGRQANLVLRQGSGAGQRARHGYQSRQHAREPAVGRGSVSAQFDVTALPPSGGLQWFQLVPKHADTDFQLVRIGFDKGELRSMFLADKLNQITQLTFSNSKRNVPLAPDLFTFVPPPGVDVIGRQAK